MIKADMTHVVGEGDVNKQLSELSLLIHVIVSNAEGKIPLTYEEAVENVVKHAKLYRLTDAGMTTSEAIDVLGIDRSKINEQRTVLPDGETL